MLVDALTSLSFLEDFGRDVVAAVNGQCVLGESKQSRQRVNSTNKLHNHLKDLINDMKASN